MTDKHQITQTLEARLLPGFFYALYSKTSQEPVYGLHFLPMITYRFDILTPLRAILGANFAMFDLVTVSVCAGKALSQAPGRAL